MVALNTRVELDNNLGVVTDINERRLYIDFDNGKTECPTHETFNKYYKIIKATKAATEAIKQNTILIDNLLGNKKHKIKDRWLIIKNKKVLYILSDGIAIKEDVANKCNLPHKVCKYNHGYRAKIQTIDAQTLMLIINTK